MMRKKMIGIALAGALVLPMFGTSTPAFAGTEVIKGGSCSAASNWKLKLKPDNGALEVDFEVDQNVSGDTWRVRMRHDGTVFFTGRRTTRGASGSFDISVREPDNAGTDSFVARARNLTTDELCVARASI